MNQLHALIGANGVKTMSSLALLELINQRRAEFGEAEARRNHFHERVRDELEGDNYQTLVVANPNGTQSEEFHLTIDQCMLVAMRESKGVRRQVQAKLRDAQAPAIDLDNPEHLRGLLVSYAEKAIELKSQLDHAPSPKPRPCPHGQEHPEWPPSPNYRPTSGPAPRRRGRPIPTRRWHG